MSLQDNAGERLRVHSDAIREAHDFDATFSEEEASAFANGYLMASLNGAGLPSGQVEASALAMQARVEAMLAGHVEEQESGDFQQGMRDLLDETEPLRRRAFSESERPKQLDGAPEPGHGVALIAAERVRQITEEGYDAEHDREHSGELAQAGAAYAYGAGYFLEHPVLPVARRQYLDKVPAGMWPWSWESWKPGDDIERTLVKAGALIAAAIDALRTGGGAGDGN